jgi:hypothetical protein
MNKVTIRVHFSPNPHFDVEFVRGAHKRVFRTTPERVKQIRTLLAKYPGCKIARIDTAQQYEDRYTI